MKSVFFSYSHKDEALRDQLETDLAMLKRQGVVSTWHDRRLITEGTRSTKGSVRNWSEQTLSCGLLARISLHRSIATAPRSPARPSATLPATRVIPVVLWPCDWHAAPFGKLLASPTDGRPVTKWPDLDEAFLDVVKAIRAAAIPKGGPATSPKPQTNNGRSA